MARLSDKDRWNDQRFRKLPERGKLVYMFLWDNCDNAGFYSIADPDIDALKIGCSPEEYIATLNALCVPKQSPSGDLHRGFILVGRVMWISHFIKHDQYGKFCNSNNRAHLAIAQLLMDKWSLLADEPEYLSVLKQVTADGWKEMGRMNPLLGHSPETLDQKPTPVVRGGGAAILSEVPFLYEKITKNKAVMDVYREKDIKEIIKMGNGLDEFKKVFELLYKKWGTEDDKKQFVTLKTFTNPAKFSGYLEEAVNSKSNTTSVYIPRK